MKSLIRAATAAALVGSLGLLPLSACSSTSEANLPDTSEPAESAPVEEEPDNSELYDNFSLEGSFMLGVFPRENTVLTIIQDTKAEAISILFVFFDGYDEYLGDYVYEWTPAKQTQTRIRIGGIDEVGSAKAYIFAYRTTSGDEWGDRHAIDEGNYEDIITYGEPLTVPVNNTSTTILP